MSNHRVSSGSWGKWLASMAEGYNAFWRGEPWPKSFSQNYEWGRYLAAELSCAPVDAPRTMDIGSKMTDRWEKLVKHAPEFYRLLVRHHAAPQEARARTPFKPGTKRHIAWLALSRREGVTLAEGMRLLGWGDKLTAAMFSETAKMAGLKMEHDGRKGEDRRYWAK
jgi:hypothetical protein